MMMAVNNTTMNNIKIILKIIFNFGHNHDDRGGGGGYVYVRQCAR